MENCSLSDSFSHIEENIARIRCNIEKAAAESGRRPEDITFMAVTKTVEPVFINHALSCGIDLIGENKVQELMQKKPFLNTENTRIHLIGHLQTNKVRQIVGQVDMIESVDSIRLAKEIDRQSVRAGVVSECLVELNIADQPTKTGAAADELKRLLYEASLLQGIKIKGLMSIPPICDSEDEVRKYFSQIYNIFIDIRNENMDNVSMDILSMGMSSDYMAAIKEGSTLVRIGSSVFGHRTY